MEHGASRGIFTRLFNMLNRFTPTMLMLAAGTATGGTLEARVVDQNNAPLENAVVYAMPSRLSGKAPAAASIEQKDKTFIPLVTAVQTGAAVSFPNNDRVRHHVYSFSPAKNFEIKLYSGVPAKPIVFDKPGIVAVGCNIHDGMIAFVYVVDTPYFAKTGADGAALIESLPSGDYTVGVWHYGSADRASETALKVRERESAGFKLNVKPGHPAR